MSYFLEDVEDVDDEIPVDTCFLTDQASYHVGVEEEGQIACDPLMMDHNTVPTGYQDPLLLDITPAPPSPPPPPLLVKDEFVEEKIVPTTIPTSVATPQAPPPPPQSAVQSSSSTGNLNMSFDQFTEEMEQQIHDIVKESVSLLGRDPRVYHPFYLRIFKYILIGKRLGYIADDPAHVDSIWSGFFKFADVQYEASKWKPMPFTGERSAYATFQLTRKVVINGKVVTLHRNEKERKKMFKELEMAAKRIRDAWKPSLAGGGTIGDDWRTRLKFFNKCRLVTHPGDCMKMNNLWSKFLSEDGFSKGKGAASNISTLLGASSGSVKAKSTGISFSTPKPPPPRRKNDPFQSQTFDQKPNEEAENACIEDSRKTLRRFIVKVIVSPSADSSLALKEATSSALQTGSTESPIPSPTPPSPPASPTPVSPPPSPIQMSPSASPISGTLSQDLKRSKNSSSAQVVSKKQKRVPASKSVNEEKRLKHVVTNKRSILKRKGGQCQPAKKSLITSNVLKRKKKLFSKLSCKGKSGDSYAERQLRLEKIINQPKAKLLSVLKKRKILKKISSAEKSQVHRSSELTGSAAPSPLSSPLPSRAKVKSPVKTSVQTLKTKTSTVRSKCALKVTTVFDKRKKRKLLHVKKKQNTDEMHSRLERMITEKKNKNVFKAKRAKKSCTEISKKAIKESVNEEKVCNEEKNEVTNEKLEKIGRIKTTRKRGSGPMSREEKLQKKRGNWEYYSKYRKLPSKCEVCNVPLTIGALGKHLRYVHEIIEDGNLWVCPVCKKSDLTTRFSWLGHIEMKHDGQVNMEDLIMVAHRVNTRLDWRTAEIKMPPVRLERSLRCLPPPKVKSDDIKLPRPRESTPRREMCDVCGKSYLQNYIAIHKECMHNPNRHKARCPCCDKELADGTTIWYHFCEFHVKGAEWDPVESVKHKPEIAKAMAVSNPGNTNKEKPPESTTCEQCGKSFCNHASLVRHLYQIHGDGQLRQNYLTCPYCPKEFKVKEVLDAHVKRIHLGTVKSKCQDCGNDLQTPGKLWKHMIDVHGISAFDAAAYCSVSFSPCIYCGKELLQGRQLFNHVKTEHPENFEDFQAADTSVKGVNGNGERVISAETAAIYREKRKLKKREERRRLREEGIGPAWLMKERRFPTTMPCPECGREYPKGLARHRRLVHGVIAEYQQALACPIEGCTSILGNLRALKTHLRCIHTEKIDEKIVEKKVAKVVERTDLYTVHQCILCEKYFYIYEEIKVHMVAFHPDIFDDVLGNNFQSPCVVPPPPPKYQCPHCDYRYSRDQDVRSHVETAHPDLCWRCPECSKVMLDPEDFDKHFMEDHNNSENAEQLEEPPVEFLTLKKNRPLPEPEPLRAKRRRRICQRKRANIIERETKKYNGIQVKCEICNKDITIRELAMHIKYVHEVEEDGTLLECTFCQLRPDFKCKLYKGRAHWLHHLELHHKDKVNMQEMIAVASKVNTKVDWRTLEIKDPTGETDCRKAQSRKRSGKRNRRTQSSDSCSTEEETDDDAVEKDEEVVTEKRNSSRPNRSIKQQKKKVTENKLEKKSEDKKVSSKRGAGMDRSVAVRTSGRVRGPPKKYKIDSDSDCEDETSDVESGVQLNRMSRTSGRGNSRTSQRPARTIGRKGDEPEGMKDNRQILPALHNIEQDKRLVIKLARLTEKELEPYFRTLPDSILNSEENDEVGVINFT